MNEDSPQMYTEYLKFELRFLDKVMARRTILRGNGPEKQLNFIDEAVEDIEGEIKQGEESNLVKIVSNNIIEKFGKSCITTIKKCYELLKASAHVDDPTKNKMKEAYTNLKGDPTQLLDLYKKGVSDFEKVGMRLHALESSPEKTKLCDYLR